MQDAEVACRGVRGEGPARGCESERGHEGGGVKGSGAGREGEGGDGEENRGAWGGDAEHGPERATGTLFSAVVIS